jgi:biopolymer transport protein ExbB/TolQ
VTPLAEGFVADALSGVASVLEVPVHVAALVLLLVLALELGRAVTELWRRHRPGRMPLWAAAREAVAQPHRAAALAVTAPTALAGRAVEALGLAVGTGNAKGVEDALTEYELGVQRRLDGTRLLVRAAPALGLMGTLIPLAPGLEALGRGDISALAADLRTAFAATVIGLLVGTVAFALTLVRTRVYTEDLAALERAVAGRMPGAVDVTTGHAAHAGGAAGTSGVAVGSAAGVCSGGVPAGSPVGAPANGTG